MSETFKRVVPPLVALCLLVLTWELYARFSGIGPTVLPAPSRVVEQGFIHRVALWDNLVPTLTATLIGFALSLLTAFVFSVVVDFSPLLKRALFPVFIASQTLPMVAIAPLVVLWFGFGLTPKILLVALVTFFPMLVALSEGYESTEPELTQLLAAMGAGKRRIFLLARLPSALPFFFAGLRISITYAVVGTIFAEYAGAARGLGIYMLNAKNNFRPDLVLAAVLLSALLTLTLFATTLLVQHFAMPWQRGARK